MRLTNYEIAFYNKKIWFLIIDIIFQYKINKEIKQYKLILI